MISRSMLVYRAGAGIARLTPGRVADAACGPAARVATLITPARRRQVERNLRRIHGPAFGGRALDAAVQATFESYTRYWVEAFRLPGTSAAELDARFRCEGWEHVEAALAGGRGVIVALPHLGGWEWAGFWMNAVAGKPVTAVVERLEPADVFDWFVELRRRAGMNVVPLGPGAGNAVLGALHANHALCLVCDRDIEGGGVDTEFFGERTTLPAGPASLALRTGAPLLPVAVYYRGRDHVAVIRPPIPVERQGKFRADVARVTQALACELEGLIRVAPEQWHLMQPNWPSDRETE